MAAITSESWARIWANAWLNEGFRKTLRKDPVAAADQFKQFSSVPLDPYDKIFDLDTLYGDLAVMGLSFETMSDADLDEISEKGTYKNAPFCLQQNEWVIGPQPTSLEARTLS